MKISAIFSDYDGTIAPDDVPLEESKVPDEIADALRALASRLPVAIITSKDYSFVGPRTPFAKAWACASGLEMVLADGRRFSSERVSGRLVEGLRYVMDRWRDGTIFEVKHSTAGKPLGFSVDWRGESAPSVDLVTATTTRLESMGLAVAYDRTSPFLDVFGARPDKGRALEELRRLLGVEGKVLFMGNSTPDNPAFDRADVSLCVESGQDIERLTCRNVVRFDDLVPFLRSLEKGDLSLDTKSFERKKPAG